MKKVVFIFLLGLSLTGYSQRIKLVEGDLGALKGLTGIKTSFNYDNMSVGKFAKEADYIAKKKGDYNDKEAGSGDKWEKAWIDDRQERFEPQFRELFAKYSGLSTVADDSPVMLIFKTVKPARD